MSIINKGTSFANGEQLTADKINDLIDLATFNQDATDSQTTDVNSAGQIRVNAGGIDTAQLATDAVETAKIKDANVTFAKLTDVIDDDTMATATDTTLATSESIKAYVTAMRPKFVALTGGTTDLTKTNQADGTTVTYNIADFTSSDSDFATSKITGLIVEGYVFAKTNTNLITASLPATGLSTVIARCYTNDGTVAISDSASTLIPINSDTSTFSFGYVVGNTAGGTYNQSVIRGAIIQPGL